MNSQQKRPITTPPGRQAPALIPIAVVSGGYKPSTVRFVDGSPCCTTTYNYRMSDEDKNRLARRIAAALNLTRGMTVEQLEGAVLAMAAASGVANNPAGADPNGGTRE